MTKVGMSGPNRSRNIYQFHPLSGVCWGFYVDKRNKGKSGSRKVYVAPMSEETKASRKNALALLPLPSEKKETAPET